MRIGNIFCLEEIMKPGVLLMMALLKPLLPMRRLQQHFLISLLVLQRSPPLALMRLSRGNPPPSTGSSPSSTTHLDLKLKVNTSWLLMILSLTSREASRICRPSCKSRTLFVLVCWKLAADSRASR